MPKKSKRGAGKKGGKGKSKGKTGKGKKNKKSDEPKEIPPPPDPDTFIWVRRQNTSLFIETTEDLTVKELKLMIATIYGNFPEDIAVFHNDEEMIEKKELKKKEDDKKKDDKKGKSADRGRGGSKDKKGKNKGKKSGSKDGDKEKEKEETVQIFTIGNYGYNARSASLFKPGTMGLVFRDNDGNFEPLQITPWTKPVEIPEIVKPYLRNYDLMKAEQDEAPPESDNASLKSKKKSK